MMPATPSVRVVVKLPYNRPENPPSDPPKIEWTSEKADILWKVIEIQRTRAVDSAGADWKGLAAHLEVPLPYLLYRVNARFQEEIRGLRDIQGALSPSATTSQKTYDFPVGDKAPNLALRMVGTNGLSSSRLASPLGVRARLTSLGNPSPRPRKATSSSTLTLQATKKSFAPLRPTSPSSSGDDTDTSDEEAIKEEEADRTAEEDEALARKLADLQKMMTNDALGLVSGTRPKDKGKAKDRGRPAPMSPVSVGSYRQDTLSNTSASRSASQSVSSAGSPQGSIPEIPSPSSERSQPQSLRGRNISHFSGSPPTRNLLGQRRYGPLVDRPSGFGSSNGSEASSFSDLSDASISASALEDAFSGMSNFGGSNASNFSQFARSRASNRTHSVVPQ